MTWPASSGLSANVTYTIFDGGTKLGSVIVNQQTAPNDFTDEGVAWKSLGSFAVTGGQIKVMLDNIGRGARFVPMRCEFCRPISRRHRHQRQPGLLVQQFLDHDRPGPVWGCVGERQCHGSRQSQACWWFPVPPGPTTLSHLAARQ